jgi:hypothetical protein
VLRLAGNPAAVSRKPGVRPVALRPTLSGGLPFSVSVLEAYVICHTIIIVKNKDDTGE